MMVTFVSQCEKNALKKTRRVLDAFANRIGDNTWQTIITQEGLVAVHKLLRHTASKSTAVSCHWIRTRARSEFIWVVGNRDKFNSDGYVAVNYSETKKFIGEGENMYKEILANTQAQRLDQHMFGVAILAKEIINKLIPDDEVLAHDVLIAGCWHDIGKIDNHFQSWLHKKLEKKEDTVDDGVHIDKGAFSWEKYPRHNEFSLLLYHLFSKGISDRCEHAIFWHHAKPIRKEEVKSLIGVLDKLDTLKDDYSKVIESTKSILISIEAMYNEYYNIDLTLSLKFPKFDDIEDKIDKVLLPKYKEYSTRNELKSYNKYIKNNSKNNLARTAIISADRLISKLSSEALEKHIQEKTINTLIASVLDKKSSLSLEIQNCLKGFEDRYPNSERNIEQSKAADFLADEEVEVGVLKGPAGCGKTKIALEWALKTGVKKIYWVCPRVQICEGLLKDLTADEYLPNTSVEIVTGEIKQTYCDGKISETKEDEEFSADIILTTVDQIVNTITTHTSVTTLVDFMSSHVVFDEYHEYITMSAFNLLFAEIVEAKKIQQNDDILPNTLLVSATPNPIFVTDFLQLNETDNMTGIESFNKSDYKISFIEYDEMKEDETNPLFAKHSKNSFVISNTAITAQKSFIDNQMKENSILLHSKYTKKDKMELFDKAFDSFKQNGNKVYDILRSGPIVQASLNITCNSMVSEMTHAENFLQRLGRLDRFGQNTEINNYTIAITSHIKIGKQLGGSAKFLAKLFSLQSTKVWYEFLDKNLNDRTIKISDIYKIYDDFYTDEKSKKMIKEDLLAALRHSVAVVEAKVIDPLSFPKKKKEISTIKIKKNSLRGDSHFVQMARCYIDSRGTFKIENSYMYDEALNVDGMTYDTNSIQGYGDSSKNLLSFMAKKHHNIKGTKKVYKDSQLLNDARDPNTPIYLSYTTEDLKKVESKPHTYAIYYGIGNTQVIGAISLQQLQKKGNDDEN